MQRFDCHIHLDPGVVQQSDLLGKMRSAGISGGILISIPPPSFVKLCQPHPTGERLDNLMQWVEGAPDLHPFYWIDPLEEDANEQVELAVRRGVHGFKVICNRFYPGDERPMAVFTKIAQARMPLLFHSGILWDGEASSRYNRPVEFEALIYIPGLKFALAHISWPWCDELIAVYGKFQNAHSRDASLAIEMFIDMTPGTPPIYREEALTRLFTVGYDVNRNVLFGTDCTANDYNQAWVRKWINNDDAIYKKLGLDVSTLKGIYSGNLLRFLDTAPANPEFIKLCAAE
ncbi:amidohydrolase family protein [candidate division KSB1 bacterium]|nr:amidohydrolase family protein [candidate division KSB1 bacterium]